MPAPDYKTLHDIAPAVERAVQSLLAAQVPPVLVFRQRQKSVNGVDPETSEAPPETLPAVRVDIKFTQGQWTGRWGVDRAGEMRHNGWSYSLQLDVRTNAYATDPAEHDRMVSIVSSLRANDFTRELLPYHGMATMDMGSKDTGADKENDQDVTPIYFHGLVVIRPDAWPLIPA
ncbi:MAG: hypothetical protein V4710_06040 [Verrucomicrobiota bacterium]